MNKIDFKKQLKELYAGEVDQNIVVTVPRMNYLMIDGHGDPDTSQDFVDAIEILYPVAYTLKFMCKKELGVDYGVMPLEGLWWAADMNDFVFTNKDNWFWAAMIMQPDFVSQDMFKRAAETVTIKKKPASIEKIRLEPYEEGRSAQVMYIGPYADEGPTIQALHRFITEQGGELEKTNKYHHEIYLSDARRSAPDKLKTIIRQPF